MTNGVIIQFFHWYNPDNTLWDELKGKTQDLVDAGFSAVWIPPCYKENNGGSGVGYGTYDLFDLGEFNQKGSTRTKYGTKTQLLDTIKTVQSKGLQVYADVVFNHKDGGDGIETIWAQEVDWNDRNRAISDWYQTAENGIWVMETDNLAAGVYQVKVQTDNTSEDAPNPVHNSFVVTDLNGGV